MKRTIIIIAIILSGCSVTGPSMKEAHDQLLAHRLAQTKMLQDMKDEEKARAIKRQGMIDRGEITGGSNEMPDYWLLFY